MPNFETLSQEIDDWLSPSELESLWEKEVEGGTVGDFAYAIHQAHERKLHPFRSEVYFYTEYEGSEEDGRYVLKLGVKIDGLRSIANRTGEYAGQKGPLWCGEDGEWKEVWLDSSPPRAAKVGILRESFDEPLWSVARWDDYAKTSKGKPTGMWSDMGAFMLGKCAESLGLRRAFPDEIGELYIPAEVDKPKGVSREREPSEAEKKAKELTDSFGSTEAVGVPDTIGAGQVETLLSVAKYEGGYEEEALKRMIASRYNRRNLQDIRRENFTTALNDAADKDLAEKYNQKREDESQKEQSGVETPIFEGFPHRSILVENGGLSTLQEVHVKAENDALQEISGIGESRASDIKNALRLADYSLPDGGMELDPDEKTLFDQ